MQIYERRAKSVKSREMALWKQITADMMSDEEKRGDTFVRRQPSYRSEKLNSFLSKLDDRFERQHSQQPRTKRLIGPPVDKPIPSHAKNWMIKKDLRKSAGQGSQEAEQEVDNVHESNSEGGSVADNSGNENSGAGVENYESSDSDSDEY